MATNPDGIVSTYNFSGSDNIFTEGVTEDNAFCWHAHCSLFVLFSLVNVFSGYSLFPPPYT